MSELKPRVTLTENGIDYELVGDYYLPLLKVPEERPIGKWGQMHRRYLKDSNPIRYEQLVLSCKLWTYLADLNEQAQARYDLIVEQMKKAECVTEELKLKQQMDWVCSMNSISNRAEEIIKAEMIFV